MQPRAFIFQLIFITAITSALCFAPILFSTAWAVHKMFALCIILLFVAISTGLYILALNTAQSPDKYKFHGVIMGSVLIKLVAGLSSLFIYNQVFAPINNLFIWVFLITYIIFTIWEVLFMTKLAKL